MNGREREKEREVQTKGKSAFTAKKCRQCTEGDTENICSVFGAVGSLRREWMVSRTGSTTHYEDRPFFVCSLSLCLAATRGKGRRRSVIRSQ